LAIEVAEGIEKVMRRIHIAWMKRPALALMLLLTPAFAEEPAPLPPASEGWSLMERGAKMLLDGLMSEMAPALDKMGRALSEIEPALREMQPALRDLIMELGDIRYYHAPEKLPNGDIIIRRKTETELRLDGLTGPEFEL